jgi:hypothetical protein
MASQPTFHMKERRVQALTRVLDPCMGLSPLLTISRLSVLGLWTKVPSGAESSAKLTIHNNLAA